MPERTALHRITIGGEKGERRYVLPGQTFTVPDAQARELDMLDPPVCYDPRKGSVASPEAEELGAEAIRRVAESTDAEVQPGQALRAPEGRDTRAAEGAGASADPRVPAAQGNNTTRQPPIGERDEL